ncbi:hypothetical protein AGLY_001352 [Aphis glycines]|uniref:Major facilitator superfamily (MFS) profile domain-containing protein n=1 Tax=Aphis glycines TaxID=307491 RepID=A0A6G0U5F5_APHGL|nr:hypothetical protein AGLY_001352 [Aphis glycines]
MSILSQNMESDLGVISVVYLSMFLDNVLLTVVVPIIPEHLYIQWITNTTHFVTNATRRDQPLLPSSLIKMKLQTLENENETIGVLLSSKAIVQLFMNPLVGILSSYVGYSLPIFLGSILLIIISVLFAYGETFVSLLVARSLQGTASALISVSGMCLIADQNHMSDLRRSKVMGLVMGSIALGVLVGYPFGGILYYFVDKSTPFNVIICAITFNLVKKSHFNNGNWKDLLKDGYILLITFSICLTSSAMAILEPFLPIWLIQIINPEKWQLGTVFIPDSLGYLIGTNFFGTLSYTMGQWRMAVLATLLVGISAIMIPAATTTIGLVCPHFGLGLGIGIVDSALVPMLANLVDTRHPNVHYGSVYALQQTAVSLAYSFGPIFGGQVVKTLGFPCLMRTIGIINISYCCLLVFLSRVSNNKTEKINIDTSIPDYKSTSVVPFFGKHIAYKKLDELDENN